MTELAERTGLTPDVLEQLRAQLAVDRVSVVGSIESLKRSLVDFFDAKRDVSNDDEHDPEGQTVAVQWSETSAMLAQSRHHLDLINAAMAKMTDGRYGSCEACGRDIAVGRLEARPHAEYCIRCAEVVTI